VGGYVGAVVNLNYDTTFDESFGTMSCGDLAPNCGFHYVGKNSQRGGVPIIRPHGSLRWSTSNFWELGRSWTHPAPWHSDMHDTPLEQLGYRLTAVPEILSFRQSLIVTPEGFKETVVANSSMPGLQDPILRNQWQELRRVASKAKHWLFFGLSLASGDDHLVFLLRSLTSNGSEKPILHVSCHGHESCKRCMAREMARRLSEDEPCIHPIEKYIDEFAQPPHACMLKS
jgi:hypothetical protein